MRFLDAPTPGTPREQHVVTMHRSRFMKEAYSIDVGSEWYSSPKTKGASTTAFETALLNMDAGVRKSVFGGTSKSLTPEKFLRRMNAVRFWNTGNGTLNGKAFRREYRDCKDLVSQGFHHRLLLGEDQLWKRSKEDLWRCNCWFPGVLNWRSPDLLDIFPRCRSVHVSAES